MVTIEKEELKKAAMCELLASLKAFVSSLEAEDIKELEWKECIPHISGATHSDTLFLKTERPALK